MWYVYILRCADGSLYIGETNDIESRVEKHQRGTLSVYTAIRRPVHLVYSETHATFGEITTQNGDSRIIAVRNQVRF